MIVAGKGGVGKTTLAAALALAAAHRDHDVLVAEVAGQSRVPSLLGRSAPITPGEEQRLTPQISSTTIDPEAALVEWAGRLIRPRALLDLAVGSNSFSGFINAAPGGRELLTITKAAELSREDRWDDQAQRYQPVILDAPASGHALAMLRTPTTFAEIARVGPIASQAREVESLLTDPTRCAIVLATTLEETPVNETIELEIALTAQLGREINLIVANGLANDHLSELEVAQLGEASENLDATVVEAVRSLHSKEQLQRDQLARLLESVTAPVVELPAITGHAIGPDEVDSLAAALGATIDTLG